MTQRKFYNISDGNRFYFFDKKEISFDDFFRIENIASIENEKMKHKIFLVSKLEDGTKFFTSLN